MSARVIKRATVEWLENGLIRVIDGDKTLPYDSTEVVFGFDGPAPVMQPMFFCGDLEPLGDDERPSRRTMDAPPGPD